MFSVAPGMEGVNAVAFVGRADPRGQPGAVSAPRPVLRPTIGGEVGLDAPRARPASLGSLRLWNRVALPRRTRAAVSGCRWSKGNAVVPSTGDRGAGKRARGALASPTNPLERLDVHGDARAAGLDASRTRAP